MKHNHYSSVPVAHFDTLSPTRSWRKPLFALLVFMSLMGLGGKAWGQFAWHNGDHITGQNNWGIGGNVTVTIDNGATVYFDGQIAPMNNAGQTYTVTIKVSGTNGTCTIRRGSGNTGALFNVYGSNNIYGPNFGAGKLVIQAGVTIDGGNIANCAPLIQVEEGGTCTLTKVTLQNNIAVQGAAINNSGTLTATNCTIQNNAASDLGGGIYTTNSATLTSCTITGNTVNGGGGAGIYASEVLSCTTCTLSNNSINNSNGSGGGIYYCGSANTTNKLTINGCTINGNSAGYRGGGIIMHVNGTTYCNGEIKGATNIYGNSAKDAGGLALHRRVNVVLAHILREAEHLVARETLLEIERNTVAATSERLVAATKTQPLAMAAVYMSKATWLCLQVTFSTIPLTKVAACMSPVQVQ